MFHVEHIIAGDAPEPTASRRDVPRGTKIAPSRGLTCLMGHAWYAPGSPNGRRNGEERIVNRRTYIPMRHRQTDRCDSLPYGQTRSDDHEHAKTLSLFGTRDSARRSDGVGSELARSGLIRCGGSGLRAV